MLAIVRSGKRVILFHVESDARNAVEEVEEQAKARRCPCGKLIRYLRALHGRKYCSALCAHGRE